MRRRILVIAAVLLGAAALILVVHDVVLFDADRFVGEWGESLVDQAMAEARGEERVAWDETEFASRARWHAGEPPCFTYSLPQPAPGAMSRIADEMVAAGVLQQARPTFSVWGHWAALDERERHGEIGAEEALALFHGASRRTRFLVALNHAKVVAAAQRAARASDAEAERQMLKRQSQFAPDDVRAARAFWQAHRLALP